MGQLEVLNTLKESRKPMTRNEIAIALNERPEHISQTIKLLLDYNEIRFIEIDKDEALKKYKCKRRMRLYYA